MSEDDKLDEMRRKQDEMHRFWFGKAHPNALSRAEQFDEVVGVLQSTKIAARLFRWSLWILGGLATVVMTWEQVKESIKGLFS